MTRAGGRRLPVLLAELHAAAQRVDSETGPKRGFNFERHVADLLGRRGFPVRAVAGGVEIFGTLPQSGFRHQIDAEAFCRDADVVGEWKAYRGPVPKNEILIFKAKTDDIYEATGGRRPRPMCRVFGMAGDGTREIRAYAARFGIALVERNRWPAAVIADPYLNWPDAAAPGLDDLRRLRYLTRPLGQVYRPVRDGGYLVPAALTRPTIEALLECHDRWSQRLDDVIEAGDLAA